MEKNSLRIKQQTKTVKVLTSFQTNRRSRMKVEIGKKLKCDAFQINGPSRRNNHCVKSVRIRCYSGPHFPTFGLNIYSDCRKMWTIVTPNTDTFYAVKLIDSLTDLKKGLK